MTLDDWCQVQEVDPVLGIIVKRLREGMLEQNWSKKTDSLELSQYRREWNNLVLKKVSCTDEPGLGNLRRPSCSWSYLLPQREVALRGCHDEVGHLGLECMLDLMRDKFFWPCMAVQAKDHIG